MARRLLIAGNWKMHTTPAEGAALARAIRKALDAAPAVDVLVFPPSTGIAAVAAELRGTGIGVGAQDLHPEDKGAFTGNVSGPMIKAAGGSAVLIGHSERRAYEKEDGALLARKVAAALRAELLPIFCCGETLAEREAGRTLQVVRTQLAEGLGALTATEVQRVVVAYEPVWAIGTGKVATPEQAQEVHQAIRAYVGLTWDAGTARATRILYGGSVKASNAKGILGQPDIDGALVGGASLEADGFAGIVFQRSA